MWTICEWIDHKTHGKHITASLIQIPLHLIVVISCTALKPENLHDLIDWFWKSTCWFYKYLHKHHALAFSFASKSQTYFSPCLEDHELPPQMMKVPPHLFHPLQMLWIKEGLRYGLKAMKTEFKPSWLRSIGSKSSFLRWFVCHG